jgi:hypothetical protein
VAIPEQHIELLRRMSELDPAPCLIGGYAEDALLAGTVTRPHGDIDWLCPRHELGLRRAQAAELGFPRFETWGLSAPGEPFYLFAQAGELKLEVGVADQADTGIFASVHSLAFDIGGRPAPTGYRIRLPDDTFRHPPVALDGITIRTASPLALYQLRAGIASQGSFGELTDRQREASLRLRERFFPGIAMADLAPRIEPLD